MRAYGAVLTIVAGKNNQIVGVRTITSLFSVQLAGGSVVKL